MRKSNFELLRLFCIFGIVVMHAMGNIDTSLSVWNTESHIFVNALFNTGVTCFILISGYFGIKFRLEKLIEMDFMVIFYTVAGVAVRGDLKAKELILACFPIITRHYWFISCYFALCFLAPLLNALAEKIKKENFERLLVTMLLLFSVIPTITTYDIMQDSGKGLVDFVMIYLIGRYLSKYPVRLQKKAWHGSCKFGFADIYPGQCTYADKWSTLQYVFKGLFQFYYHGVRLYFFMV